MSWSKAIILSFILFAVFVAAMVTVCVRQDIGLVTRDYYKEELQYQEQLDRKQNALNLEARPDIVVREDNLEIHYAEMDAVSTGTVTLFRPSNAALDREFRLLVPSSEAVQRFPLRGAVKGLYKARMRWVMRGKEYFMEKVIVI